jgi:hypothetical protein
VQRNEARRNTDPWVPEMNAWKSQVRERNLTTVLTLDDYKSLVTAPCYYCGEMPSSDPHVKHMSLETKKNGIDRLNNDVGYEPGNCVSSCKWCNWDKSDQSYEQFVERTRRRYEHLKKIGVL